MDVKMPTPGAYVVAVSGGVDSMALLHMLHKKAGADPAWQLTVAHLDHGIRTDSAEDRRLVQNTATRYGLPFVYQEAQLGAKASEARAREARYSFLRTVKKERAAQAIITAHHQDDLLETAILNMLRGTGRKGLTSLSSTHEIVRPLLAVPKSRLVGYAKQQRLQWHDDPTNQDDNYLRNYVRRQIMPRLGQGGRQKLLDIINETKSLNWQLDRALGMVLQRQIAAGQLDRTWFNTLSNQVALEVMAAWLRTHGTANFSRRNLQRLVIAAKITVPGKRIDILDGTHLRVTKEYLALSARDC